jgi:5'-nucleotidase
MNKIGMPAHGVRGAGGAAVSGGKRVLRLVTALSAALALSSCGSDDNASDTPVQTATTPAPTVQPLDVQVLAFNDFHGHLQSDSPGTVVVPDPADSTRSLTIRAGGAAYLSTRLQQLRAEVANTVVVSTGDSIGAAPLVNTLFSEEPAIEVKNLMGVDLGIVGNHEFDQGRAELDRIMRGGCRTASPDPNKTSCARSGVRYAGARFPMLAANVVDATNQPILQPFFIRDFGNGFRMAFIGVVLRTTPTIVTPSGVAGLRFLDEAETINRYVGELRAQGIRAIVAMVHEGGFTDTTFDAACRNPRGPIFEIVDRLDREVDLVLSAHTHQAYNCTRNGIQVIQGAAFGRLISQARFQLDATTRDVVKPISLRNVPVPNDLNTTATTGVTAEAATKFPPLAADPAVAALVAAYADLARPRAERPVGTITATIDRTAGAGGDHPAGNLIADAQLEATAPAQFGGAQIAFMNPGGVRGNFVFDAPAGSGGLLTFGEAFTVQPFGNSLVTMTLTGQQIKDLLEQQWNSGTNTLTAPRILLPSASFSYSWNNAAPAGSRVVASSMLLNGAVIGLATTYRVTVNSFLADGGDNFSVLTQGTSRLGGAQDIDALIAYFAARSAGVAPPATGRITRTN